MKTLLQIICFALAAAVLCLPWPARAGTGSQAAAWRRVSPSLETKKFVRLHRWHELPLAPAGDSQAIAEVREALTAERINRLRGAIDLGSPGDLPALHWAAREDAAAAEIDGRRGNQRDRREGGGMLDSWISDFVVLQEKQSEGSIWGDPGAVGMGGPGGDRSWGWLADEVFERERSAQEGYHGGGFERSRWRSDDHAVSGEGGALPGWHPYSDSTENAFSGRP